MVFSKATGDRFTFLPALHDFKWELLVCFSRTLTNIILISTKYRGSPPYTPFETQKKPCCMKFVSPTNAKIPHLHVRKPKTEVVETVFVIFV